MHILFSKNDVNFDGFNNSFFRLEKIPPGDYDADIDQRIHEFLKSNKNTEIKSFTLPISFSGNYMEFSGLIFSLHLRLTRDLSFCNVPIIFYGTLELEQVLRLTTLSNILITKNVRYVNLQNASFEDIKEHIMQYKNKDFNLNEFINQIKLNPPSNYDSHHNTDNEFALIQWSKHINCFDKIPQNFKREFESQLYLKYLNASNPLPVDIEKNDYFVSNTADINLLLIDDEAEKGWKIFYSSLFANSKINFIDSGIEFKKEDKNVIIHKAEKIIKEKKPNVILLDLRLHDSDFSKSTSSEDLTGIKILEKIKEINKGIQVVITTASNKAWNFNLAKQKGAYDFIIKDGLEDPNSSIQNFTKKIESAIKKSLFSITIYEKLLFSLKNWRKYNIPKRKNIADVFHDPLWHINLKNQVFDFINNAFDTINNDTIPERFTMSILLIYRVIEMVNEFYIIESGDSRKG